MTIRTDLSGRLRDGRRIIRQKYQSEESTKLGNLRAGNSGIMSEQGDIAGSCHRKAHLRSLGMEIDPPDDSRQIMFQMGTANEDVVYNDLMQTKAEDEVILRETEIPITWFTSNGTKVTGRPDMVVCKAGSVRTWYNPAETSLLTSDVSGFIFQGRLPEMRLEPPVPIYGIEIKSIASVWTSRDIIGERTPKMEHLIQAAHYSWKLGQQAAAAKSANSGFSSLPFKLLYKQYGIQEIPGWKGSEQRPGWSQKLFPKQGAPGSELIDYEKGRIQPFEISFELEFTTASVDLPAAKATGKTGKSKSTKVLAPTDEGLNVSGAATGGRLRFREEGTEEWTLTLVTTLDIERYYEFVSSMAQAESLGPRPMNMGPQGKTKNWTVCDYCPLSSVCDSHEGKGYTKWLQAVQKQVK